jgi:Pyruvate/2-oxoacid:ferredoxin oxidoreductase delta subunit
MIDSIIKDRCTGCEGCASVCRKRKIIRRIATR